MDVSSKTSKNTTEATSSKPTINIPAIEELDNNQQTLRSPELQRSTSQETSSDPFTLVIDENLLNRNTSDMQLDSETDDKTYLTAKDFYYSMNLIDKKITSLYKLCRYIGEQQHKNSKALQKLVALDELSDDFWNVSYLIYFTVFYF